MSEAIYSSKYTNKKVTAAQLLAEKMVERKFALQGVKLPWGFWNNLKYRREFMFQMREATKVLRLYSFEAVNKVIESKEAQRTYSLAAKWLDPLFICEQERLNSINREVAANKAKAEPAKPTIDSDKPVEFRKEFKGKPNIKDLL